LEFDKEEFFSCPGVWDSKDEIYCCGSGIGTYCCSSPDGKPSQLGEL
jgi:hypothetical protein